MLHEEGVEAEIGFLKGRGARCAGVLGGLPFGFLGQHRLEVKVEEEPSPPDAVSASGAFAGAGFGDGE